MPVTAITWLRPMRGGSQTHLIKASDGHHYVVKLTNNPQGLRTLINEWISQRILTHLRIPCPEVEIIDLPQPFIEANPKLGILRNQIVQPPPSGWHFGSRYPGDPTILTVFDILPDIQLVSCRNVHHFPAILCFDKWAANADSRQCVFYRARLADVLPSEDKFQDPESAMRGLVASMIDHGYCFNGTYWDFPDAPGYGLYHRPEVYRKVRGWAEFEPWLERIQSFPTDIFDKILHEIPRAWLPADQQDEITNLFDRLLSRRAKVPHLIEAVHNRYPTHFPNWR
jgi:hypothetical protein